LVGADDGWAVGRTISGWIYHWDGSQWTMFSEDGFDVYSSVFFVDASDGWIVGGKRSLYSEGSSAPVYHWNGTGWTFVASPTLNPTYLLSVFMVDANDGWIVGAGGTIMRWTGVEWTIPEYPGTLFFVLMLGLTLTTVALTKTALRRACILFLVSFARDRFVNHAM